MRCAVCGAQFRPRAGGRPQKYCSRKCQNRAKVIQRHERKEGRKLLGLQAASDETVPTPDAEGAAEAEKHVKPAAHDIGAREFERMMDGSVEDMLRENRDVLRDALRDPDTPRTALAAISKQLLEVTDRLEALTSQADGIFEEDEAADDERFETV